MWGFGFIGVQWGLAVEDRLCSSVCSHFSPFIFSVFMHWSLTFWCFLSFCLLYALCPIFRTIFGLHFGVLWGSFVFQHLQFLTKRTIFLVFVSSQFVAPYSCFENAVSSRNILSKLREVYCLLSCFLFLTGPVFCWFILCWSCYSPHARGRPWPIHLRGPAGEWMCSHRLAGGVGMLPAGSL